MECTIHSLAADGDLPGLKNLLLKHVPEQAVLRYLSSTDEQGWTPMHAAAAAGRCDVLRFLLGLDCVDARDVDAAAANTAETPFYVAVRYGQLDAANLLADHGADVTLPNHLGFTPLHEAAMAGSASMVIRLLELGLSVDAVGTCDGSTPLCWAIVKGQLDAARLLLEHGADPNFQWGSEPVLDVAAKAWRPEHRCVSPCGHPAGRIPDATRDQNDLVALLLANGADPHHGAAASTSGERPAT